MRANLSERRRFYEAGERLIQADLGRTLRRIAEGGPDQFYEAQSGTRLLAISRRTTA